MKTLSLTPQFALTMACSEDLPQRVSAASALVMIGEMAYTVADDECHLARFDLHQRSPGQWIRLGNRSLPADKKARKAQKPDWEAMTLLAASEAFPHGALMAVGSGSTDARTGAWIIAFDQHGTLLHPRHFSLKPLYDALKACVSELNIEGLLVHQSQLLFFNRANNQQPKNAIVMCDLQSVLDLCTDAATQWQRALEIVEFELPRLHGVVLGITDAVLLASGEVLFSAAAEATDDSYNDGECMGSVLGVMSRQGEITSIRMLEPRCKVEGVALHEASQSLYVVSDADNPDVPATLYSVPDWQQLLRS